MRSINEISESIHPTVVAFRRDIHKYPEGPLAEYRTASMVIKHLQALGYEVFYGDDANNLEAIKNILPPEEKAAVDFQRALDTGADPELLERMKYNKTGVVGVLRCGEGPVVGIRCDMDAVFVDEWDDEDHIPVKEGFRSVNEGLNHACGHDAHTAIGIGIAEVMAKLKEEGKLKGTLKLLFEPAEEIFAGARSMIGSGIADDLTHLFAVHMAVSTKRTGQVAASVIDFPIIKKYDVKFIGQNAHADYAPEQGKNALLAACTATVGLNAITRHSGGNTRINVGLIRSGSTDNLNAIPGEAEIVLELLAFDQEVFDFLYESSLNVINGAASMYGCKASIDINKSAAPVESVKCDPEAADIIRRAVDKVPEVDEFIPAGSLRGAGEDASLFIRKAQENGGIGTYIMFGSDLSNEAHTPFYDVDERTLNIAVKTMANAIYEVMEKND